jgi:hypothetical protein
MTLNDKVMTEMGQTGRIVGYSTHGDWIVHWDGQDIGSATCVRAADLILVGECTCHIGSCDACVEYGADAY